MMPFFTNRMKSIKEAGALSGKRVIVRVDFNVPIINGKVRDDFRIKKALPTIEFLVKKGAKVILLAHLGEDGSASLEPIANTLKKYIAVSFIKTSLFSPITDEAVLDQKKGTVILLENIRREKAEKENTSSFGRALSRFGDIYVNDAFSVSHRVHASVVGIPKHIPSYAGFQLLDEVKHLSSVFTPPHPFLCIFGGAKFETKVPLVKKFIREADTIFIAGALMNTFFKTKGYEVGQSLVEEGNFGIPKLLKDTKIILPSDVVVAQGKVHKVVSADRVSKDDVIVDIGTRSVEELQKLILRSKCILWNGPLGKYESGFGGATEKILKTIALSKAKSVIGGGDTVALVDKLKLEKKLGFVSTGGGATLDFLAKGTLPGIKALK